ncbi:MAG: hypothetical protein PF692_15675 [Kiritimatiellae bacterium]|nr:hypothetical protein [Kiritimatiellia bacterium]
MTRKQYGWKIQQAALLDLEFIARVGSIDVESDKIHFYPFTSIVIALGGESQDNPIDPAAPNEGTFNLAVDLFSQGYDVHMYGEDNVQNNGDGQVYDEIVNAIQMRNISNVAIFGYSHGGGSTHDLAERLNTNRSAIGTFSIGFTGYIDAVTQVSSSQENRRPPGSQYHVTYYQEGVANPLSDWFDYGLDGGLIANPALGDPAEVNIDAAQQTCTHMTIDDLPVVLNGIEGQLMSVITK